MRVTDVDVRQTPRGARLGASIVWENHGGRRETLDVLYRNIDADAVTTPGDALAAIALMPAMAGGEDVEIEAPVSARLHAGLGEVADTWAPLMRGWRRSRVCAHLVDRSNESPSVTAACFSAGVDSFYTVLRERDEPIDALITLREFTSHPGLLSRADDGVVRLSDAARGLGFEPIVVESSAYAFCARHIPVHPVFVRVFTGAVLSAPALGLGSLVRRCLIAAGHPYGVDVPTGIDPLVRCFSSEAVDVVFDGHGVEREEKIRLIAKNPVVLKTLSVCPQIRPAGVGPNCRRCDKCIESSFLLQLEGVLDRCRTLGPLTPAIMRRTIVRPLRDAAFGRLRELTGDPQMRRAITVALRRSRVRRLFRPLGSLLRRWGLR